MLCMLENRKTEHVFEYTSHTSTNVSVKLEDIYLVNRNINININRKKINKTVLKNYFWVYFVSNELSG